MSQRLAGILAAVALSGGLVWAAFGAEPTRPGLGAATQPGTAPAAPPGTAPGVLNVEKIRFVGLMGDPRFRHAAPISRMVVVDNGRQVLTGGLDGMARLWDAATGREMQRYQPSGGRQGANMHTRSDGTVVRQTHVVPFPIEDVQLLGDGKTVMTIDKGGQLTLFDRQTGRLSGTIQSDGANSAFLASMPAGQEVFVGDSTGRITLWDVAASKSLRQWSIDGDNGGGVRVAAVVRGLALSPDGKLLLACDQDGAISAWEAATGQLRYRLTAPRGPVHLAFPRQGDKFASVSADKIVRLWDAREGKPLWQVNLAGNSDAVAFSPDTQTVAVTADNYQLHLLDAAEGKERLVIDLTTVRVDSRTRSRDEVLPVAFSNDGKEVLCAVSGVICRWDSATGKRVFPPIDDEVTGHAMASCLALSSDGLRLYSAGWESSQVLVWDVRQQRVAAVWEGPGPIRSLQLSSSGKLLLAGGVGQAAIIDVDTGRTVRQFAENQSPLAGPWLFAENDRSVVADSRAAALAIFNAGDGGRRTVGAAGDAGTLLAAVPRGQQAAVFSKDQLVTWNLSGEQAADHMPGKGLDHVYRAAFVPRTSGLLTGGLDGEIRFWDRQMANGQPGGARDFAQWVRNLGDNDYAVREQATAQLVAAGAAAQDAVDQADMNDAEVAERVGRIRLAWDKDSAPDHQAGQALVLDQEIRALALHSDGRHWAVIAGTFASARLVLGEITPQGPRELRRPDDEPVLVSVLFSPDGKTLFVGTAEGTILLYRAE